MFLASLGGYDMEPKKSKKFNEKKLKSIYDTLNEEQKYLLWRAVWATPAEEEFFFYLWVDDGQIVCDIEKMKISLIFEVKG